MRSLRPVPELAHLPKLLQRQIGRDVADQIFRQQMRGLKACRLSCSLAGRWVGERARLSQSVGQSRLAT